mmetsp:Transcript_39018/g.98817  ORF Transcript_39018/g.98817 Transcript_39018/m.98817 type:complete len:166 (+) Transcript_39018:185-682(+)|eukprot:jgi/Tetstr1/446827/TSEL_034307.t1
MPRPQPQTLPAALALLATLLLGTRAAEDKSNGFNSAIDWKSMEDMNSFDYASNTKPIMYLFNKPWCGACKRLKSEFVGKEGMKIAEMAKDFVMVNVGEDVSDKKFSPDGGYIPRILYAEPDGDLRSDVTNKMGNPKYGYFYSSAWEVEKGMTNALSRLTGQHTEL